MKKVILLILAVFISWTAAFAQSSGEEIVIKLKNDLEIRGYIIEEEPGQSITIKTSEGDVFSYRESEISKIYNPNISQQKLAAKEKEKNDKLLVKESRRLERNTLREERKLGNFKGYRGIIEASFGYDVLNWHDYPYICGSFINGYNFSPYFFLGLGVGINYSDRVFHLSYAYYDSVYFDDSYSWEEYESDRPEVSIPIFAQLRFAFCKNTKVTPYFAINVGYNCALGKTVDYDYDMGVLVLENASAFYGEPSLGIEIRVKQKQAVSFAFTVPMLVRTHRNCEDVICVGAKLGYSF